jgi:hypothetical protein
MAGRDGVTFLHRDWRRTVGTHRVTERRIRRRAPAAPASATLAGVALLQPQELQSGSAVHTQRTEVTEATVTAVPVPRLRPPGTFAGDVSTIGQGLLEWSRRLPSRGPAGTLDVEVGHLWYEQRGVDPDVMATALRQRCRAGQRLRPPGGDVPPNACQVIGDQLAGRSTNAVVDTVTGRAHVVVTMADERGRPVAPVDLTWRGRGPLGYLESDRLCNAPDGELNRYDRSGVRWRDLRVEGTVDGGRPARVWGVDLTVFRERQTFDPSSPSCTPGR